MVKKIKKPSKNKKKVEKELQKKLMLFDKLEDECLTCGEIFDKTDKEQVKSWNVVVKEDSVRLYCPTCWETAIEIVQDFRKRVEERNADT